MALRAPVLNLLLLRGAAISKAMQLRAYQKAKGLTVSGVYDAPTRAQLEADGVKTPAPLPVVKP
jgi:peptidoglycan hydrolase-like protein with peptidoglycan-binding domain